MKSLRFFLPILPIVMLVCFTNCSSPKETRHAGNESGTEDHVEVIYFHGKMRCLTCRAIEKYAKETVASLFNDAVKGGKVIFRVIDIQENEAMADSYQTTGSSLFITSFIDGKETRKDMTEFGFKTARKEHQIFQDSLVSAIKHSLNNMKP